MIPPKFTAHFNINEKGLITTYYKAMEVDQWIEKVLTPALEQCCYCDDPAYRSTQPCIACETLAEIKRKLEGE